MYKFFKRFFDFVVAAIAIIILSPILLVIYGLVIFKLGYPGIFKQERPGLNGKIFTLYKFRSMTNAKNDQGVLLPNQLRLTKFGKFLRSTSLDELPELLNIVKGDMSIVGPRPLLVKYLSRYSDEQARRHEVRPGITGLAQVNGRNSITWEEKFAYDVLYVDKYSFWLDIKILLKTLAVVFRKDGINSTEEITMEEFLGDS